MVEKEIPDMLLLDLRCSRMRAGETTSAIKELCPVLVGRILTIIAEVSDPQTLKMIMKSGCLCFSWQQVGQNLWERLCSLWGFIKPFPEPDRKEEEPG
jgi:hypothetical protein